MDKKFQVGDIVWASAKRDIFWPAKVCKITHSLEGDQPKFRKAKKTASGGSVWVDFYGEETQEKITLEKNIRSWNCAEEQGFIKKGREMKDNRKKLIFNRGLKKACDEAGSGYQRNGLKRSPRKSMVLVQGHQTDEQPGTDEGIRKSPRKSFSSPLKKTLKENIGQTLFKAEMESDKDINERMSFKKKLFLTNGQSAEKPTIKHTGKRKRNKRNEEQNMAVVNKAVTIEHSGVSKKHNETISDVKSVGAKELNTQNSKIGPGTNAYIECKARSNTAKDIIKSSGSVTVNHKGKRNAVTKSRRKTSPIQSEETKHKKTRTCVTVSKSNVRHCKSKTGNISNDRSINGKTKSEGAKTGKRRSLKKKPQTKAGRTLVRERGKFGKVSKKSRNSKETRMKLPAEKKQKAKKDSDVSATKKKEIDNMSLSKRKSYSKCNDVEATLPRKNFPNVKRKEKDSENQTDSEQQLNNRRRNSLSKINRRKKTKACGDQTDLELHSVEKDSTGEPSECSKVRQTAFKSREQGERSKSKSSLEEVECNRMKQRKRKICGGQSDPELPSARKDLTGETSQEQNERAKSKSSLEEGECNSTKGSKRKICGGQSDPELPSVGKDSWGETQQQRDGTENKNSLEKVECKNTKGRKRKVSEVVDDNLDGKMKMNRTSLDNLPLNRCQESFPPVFERQDKETQGEQSDSKLHSVREGKKKYELVTMDMPEQVSRKEQLNKVDNKSVGGISDSVEGSKRKAGEALEHASKRKYQKKQERIDKEVPSLSKVNSSAPGNGYSHSSSDDDVDTSDDELPEAFTPSHTSSQGCYSVGELVWVKYGRNPYWPSQVKKITPAKRKLDRKIYVKFLCDYTNKLFRIQPKNMLHFACEPARREELMNEGNRIKVESQKQMFQDAVVFAEQLILRKGLGKETEDLDEEYEIVESSEEKEDQTVEAHSDNTVGTNEEGESTVRKSSRKRRHTSKYNDILNYVKQARAHLKLVYEGKKPSERHRIFKSGTVKERNNLKRLSGFGPVEDPESERVMKYLLDYYSEMDNVVQFSEVHYVSEVWLPEALIFTIQQIEHVDREKAEEIYRRGGTEPTMTNQEAEQLVDSLWRKRRLTEEEREEVMERAELRLSRDASPLL